jgi:methionine-gamma-lyase
MLNCRELSEETQCVHAGHKEDVNGAVVTPIYQTSTFRFKNTDHGAELFRGEGDGYIYTRMRNPTVEAMEDAVAILERGYKALGCASGMAAVHTVFAAMVQNGDHVICGDSVYGPTAFLISQYLVKLGITYDFVDTSDVNKVKAAIKPNTKMIYAESPGNPTMLVSDIKGLADLAHAHGARLVIDNTFMGPILQRPLELGADVVLHSMTKFLNGHADVIAGAVVVNSAEDYKHFRKVLNHTGGVIDPFNAFLVHRGIKTLKLRVLRQCENAMKVAEYLEKHPKIEWVAYPGLKSHPQHELSKKQACGFGCMMAVEVKGGVKAGKAMMDNIHIWQLAVSLGGVESLVQHPASMTHASMSPEQRLQGGITDGLVRVSVGIEGVDDLIKAMDHALSFC